MLTVAGDRPMDVFVLLDEPLWRVLYLYHQMTARDARAALERRSERVDLGKMVAEAFHAPAMLNDEVRMVAEAIREHEHGPVDRRSEIAELRARGEALAARIEAGRVLSPGALLS